MNTESLLDQVYSIIQVLGPIVTAVLVFVIRKQKNNLTKEKNEKQYWKDLIDDSASYRDEVREDLEKVKEKKEKIESHAKTLEKRISELIDENIELKTKAMMLEHQLKVASQGSKGE